MIIIREPAKGWGVSLGASNRERAYVQSGLCTDSSSSNPFYPIIYGITANANPISLLHREWVSAQKGWEKEGAVAKMLTAKKGEVSTKIKMADKNNKEFLYSER